MTIPPQFQKLIDALKKKSVRFCLLRESEIIETSLKKAEEIDLWCPLADLKVTLQGVHDHGWIANGGRHLNATKSWETIEIRFTHPKSSEPDLDLFSGALRWRWCIYQTASRVLEDRTYLGGLPFVAGSTELHILITRMSVRGELKGMRLQRAKKAWTAATLETKQQWREECRYLLGKATQRRLENALKEKQGFECNSRLHGLLRCIRIPHTPRCELALKSMRAILLPRNEKKLLCYFVGTDGSGKSTLIQALLQNATKQHNMASAYWGRSRGNSHFVVAIRNILFKLVPQYARMSRDRASGDPRIDRNHETHPNILYRITATLAAFIYMFDFWWRSFFQLRPQTIHLIDRGPLDLLLIRDAYKLTTYASKFSPRADLIIFCNAPVALIYQRKQDRTLATIQQQQKTYARNLHLGRNSITIDSSLPLAYNTNVIQDRLHYVALVKSNHMDASLLNFLPHDPRAATP